ncbi:hypothetical protein QVD99_005558 [Batrachochytrium dendrobatidis]|nr:hypothetical protein O5D80_002327 [Batrachochytrium dendrobatidis]KAK5668545.1 hypothetical protein QVD99_005558 [Batrachochytrium dendrobatidis]
MDTTQLDGFVESKKVIPNTPSETTIVFLSNQAQTPESPDGGYGWLIVAASFVINIFIVGLPASYGVFEVAFTTQEDFKGTSSLAIAFIGSLATVGMPLFAIMSGRLSDIYGPRVISCIGAVIVCLSLIIASFSVAIWHLYITQGFLFGLGTSLSYIPILGVLPDWFQKRRGLAMGIAVSGGGIGGLAIAPILQKVISTMGWRWALRIIGIASGAGLFTSGLFLKMRVPSKRSTNIDFSYFKDSKFVRLFLMALVISLGWFVPLFYIPGFAVQYGMSKNIAALLVGLTNGASGIGRVTLGYLADTTGPVNVLIFCNVVATLLIFLLWPFATTLPLLLVFVILFGFVLGGFASLVPTVVSFLFGSKGNLATVTGMIFTGYISNLFGSPIAGVIIDHFTTYTNGIKNINFTPAIMYTGACFFVAASLLISIRYSMRKRTVLE